MSGIIALLHRGGGAIDPSLLERLTGAMAYRGPDARETWSAGEVGFGHAMFRTTWESAREHQPYGLDRRWWITADVRLDDRQTLVNALRAAGRDASLAQPDPELLLAAYATWGEDCVHRLLGDWAFIAWDAHTRRLFCARDPFGVRFLYYARAGEELVVGNTLRAIREHPRIPRELNDQAIADFLLFGFNPDLTTTSFAAISRLPPGHTLTVAAGDSAPVVRRWWSFPSPPPLRYRRDEQYVEHFRELLDAAVADRMRLDRVGISMSGGIDSTMIAAAASKIAAGRGIHVRAFTTTNERLYADDERHYAELAAERIGVELEVFDASDFAFLDDIGRQLATSPEPLDNPSLRQYRHWRSIHAGFSRVVLEGEDGDALLAPPRLTEEIHHQGLGSTVRRWAQFLIRRRTVPYAGLGVRTRLGRIRPAPLPPFPVWVRPDLATRLDLRNRFAAYWQERPPKKGSRLAWRLTAPYWQVYLGTLDPGATGVLVETRLPLLDVRLVSFAAALPSLPWKHQKALFRAAMRGVLPEAVLARPKTPARLFWPARMQQLEASGRPLPDAVGASSYVLPDVARACCGTQTADVSWATMRPILLAVWMEQLGHACPDPPTARRRV